jgi:hypothetical protein
VTQKLTPEQYRRIEEIEEYLKVVAHLKKLVAELEASRAAPARVIQNICETMARELSRMRQRLLTSNIGTLADVAGTMSVIASRGGGIELKIRALGEGVGSLTLQLDQALKSAAAPEAKPPPRKQT